MTHVTTSDTLPQDIIAMKQRLDELERLASVLQPGQWTNLALTANIISYAGFSPVAARIENGSVVRLRGLVGFSATYTLGVTIATLPAGSRPPFNQEIMFGCYTTTEYTGIQVAIGTNGVINPFRFSNGKAGTTLPIGAAIFLDGETFPST